MILLDSAVLVAICDRTDSHAPRALHQLKSLNDKKLRVTLPVLTESWHFLDQVWQRSTLVGWLRDADVQLVADDIRQLPLVWKWLEKYRDHRPDFADAHLVITAVADKRFTIWTYDSEFSTIWRNLDGSRIRLTFPIR